jgi:hypothetical protein
MIDSTPTWGGRVVYGDTDSIFISLPGKTKAEAFRIGQDIADKVTLANPSPIKLKFEKVSDWIVPVVEWLEVEFVCSFFFRFTFRACWSPRNDTSASSTKARTTQPRCLTRRVSRPFDAMVCAHSQRCSKCPSSEFALFCSQGGPHS